MAAASDSRRSTALSRGGLLFGVDSTPGIVSVSADRRGHARIWRRVDGRVLHEEATFPNWALLAAPELLDGLPWTEVVSATGAPLQAPGDVVGVLPLAGDNPFRILALTNRLDVLEPHVVEVARRAIDDGSIRGPLKDLIYIRPADEQYLTITGRTYFRGMAYGDLRRLQFDLETSGLGTDADQIFMVSIKDSDGFATVLDVESRTEADLIREFARIVIERDPDVIENHNIFDFDIRFLLKRAQALAIALPLGRDGTGFLETRDTVRIGNGTHSFTRYKLVGREIVDTLHVTRRFRELEQDMPSSGLKDAARHFGVATEEREYIGGAEIWRTFQRDPERVRRYCWDDVDEVDRISQLLLAPSFTVATLVPKPYERIVTTGPGQGLVEPLMVRAYIAEHHSLPSASEPGPLPEPPRTTRLVGVVRGVVRADIEATFPDALLSGQDGAPDGDALGAVQSLVAQLRALDDEPRRGASQAVGGDSSAAGLAIRTAASELISSCYSMLGSDQALFADPSVAVRVAAQAALVVEQVVAELTTRGAQVVEADARGVLFGMPEGNGGTGSEAADKLLVDAVDTALPPDVRLRFRERYRAMYNRGAQSHALLRYPEARVSGFQERGALRIVGPLRSSRGEAFIDHVFAGALHRLLEDDVPGARAVYRREVARLRAREVTAADLALTVALTKTPQAYRQAALKEDAYEAYLAAGYTSWQTGTRVQYYRATGGNRLVKTGAIDYDIDYYVNRLRRVITQRLDCALAPDDLDVVFSEQDGLFDPPLDAIVFLCRPFVPDDVHDDAGAGQRLL